MCRTGFGCSLVQWWGRRHSEKNVCDPQQKNSGEIEKKDLRHEEIFDVFCKIKEVIFVSFVFVSFCFISFCETVSHTARERTL